MSTNRYDLASEATRQARITARLLYISTAKYGGDWHCVPHTHSCAELFYVLSGKGQFIIESQTFPVSAGDLIIVNPLVHHTETSLDANPLEYIVLGVDGLELATAEEQAEDYCVVNFREADGDIRYLLQSMLREIETRAPEYESVCQNLLDILVILLMRRTDFSSPLSPVSKNVSKECAVVRRFIDSHFKENLNLDLLAQVAHVNKYHLSHSFSREYGISPISYLLSLRIQESQRLLSGTDHSLAQIAQFAGFSSPSYFSQSFRKSVGMSPMQYRMQTRQNGSPEASKPEEETP